MDNQEHAHSQKLAHSLKLSYHSTSSHDIALSRAHSLRHAQASAHHKVPPPPFSSCVHCNLLLVPGLTLKVRIFNQRQINRMLRRKVDSTVPKDNKICYICKHCNYIASEGVQELDMPRLSTGAKGKVVKEDSSGNGGSGKKSKKKGKNSLSNMISQKSKSGGFGLGLADFLK